MPAKTAQKPPPRTGPAALSVRGESKGPTVQAWAVPHLIACVEAQGVDASSIRALRWLGDLGDPDVRVPEVAVEAAWRLAAELTQDDALGIHVAESLPRGAIDLIEYAFRSSPSLKAGLERVARYGRLLSDRLSMRIESQESGLLVLVRDAVGSVAHPSRMDFGLATLVRLARDTTGVGITPREICLAHQPPPTTAEHTRFFGRRPRFNAGAASLIFSAEDAALPLRGADTALAEIVRKRLDKLLAARALPTGNEVTTRVRRMMVEKFGEQTMTPDTVAEALSISRRTLSRRLADDGTSFRQLLDEVRADFARALLQDRSQSIADIAFFLQYSEPAAFHRSFRRWTGETPRAYRAGV
jgi:AraC-like DNA-binding protein